MSNCLNCGKANPPSQGRRKRKYCSKKCANKYLYKTKRYGCTRPLGWIRKSHTRLEERKQRKEDLASCEADPNLFSMSDVAKLGNIEKSNVSVRYKKLEITPARSITGNRLYFSKEQVDQILDYENHIIPRNTYQYTDIDTPEFKKIWALENIRPLSRKKNIEKGSQ